MDLKKKVKGGKTITKVYLLLVIEMNATVKNKTGDWENVATNQ